MATLTQKQKNVLAKVLSGSGPYPASENAQGFRASNEDDLGDLDDLEHEGVLIRKDNAYSVSLRALTTLLSQNPDADRIYHLCDHLFGVVRHLYKARPGQTLYLGEIIKAADLPEGQIRRGLTYLSQVSELWTSFWLLKEANPLLPSRFQPAEAILTYKTFEDLIAGVSVTQRRTFGFAPAREKQQKFGVLDSPTLLKSDLRAQPGILGLAMLYLDLDNFKEINTKLTEVVVDRLILPPTHEVLANCVKHVGFAYAEGGDEFTILLPNSSEAMALEFARAVRAQISATRFNDSASQIRLNVSIGVAHVPAGEDSQVLRHRANLAKSHAKNNGKNCISIWGEAQCRIA